MDHQDIDDEPSYKSIFCQSCGMEITSTQNIAAERFQGRLGPATLYKTAINITVMNTQSRELLSGVYQVADVNCRSCSKVIGWYYYQVTNKNNEWKIGKYCLEDQLANSTRVYKSPVIQRERVVKPPPQPAKSAVSSMMTMMSPAAVVNAVVRSSSKMMSSSLDDDDDDEDQHEDEAESESSDEDDVSVCSTAAKDDEDDVVEDDDDDSDEEESDQDDVDEWEVVELIEMPA